MKILFVCLGNICRSPTAHGVFLHKLGERGITHVEVDSAGTAAYHIGKAPDERTQKQALTRGYDLSPLRARQAVVEDFYQFDFIFAMDEQNYQDLKTLQPKNASAKLQKALSYSSLSFADVPDPYYGGQDGFEQVLDICEQLSDDIIENVVLARK